MSYNVKVYKKQGGDELVVASGGKITVQSGGVLDVLTGGLIKANGTQSAHIADAVVAHALNSTFSDTEAEAALNALGVKINAIIDILEANGLSAAS